MKTIYKYLLPSFLIMGLVSCSLERPFEDPSEKGYGQLVKSAVNLEIAGETVTTKADENDLINDFDIVIKKATEGTQVVKEYYGNLPDVISLPEGEYILEASYGENPEAEFEQPYYFGKTETKFKVEKNKITSDIGKIQCKLENIKVSIVFHPNLVNALEEKENACVEVKLQEGQKILPFTLEHSDAEIPGFFRHTGETTLVATFKGKVGGKDLAETKTLKVATGNHYRITFNLHNYNGEDWGDISPDVEVDASVTVEDVNNDVIIQEDQALEDNERPKEDQGSNEPGTPDTPDNPNDPDTPAEPQEPGPSANLVDGSTVVLGRDAVNYINPDTKVVLQIHSDAEDGIETFTVTCESKSLDLEGMGAENGVLDMVNPGQMLGTLHDLHLLDENKDSVKGEHDVRFDISGFMGMLMILGEDQHLFCITISDADGVREIYLNLIYDESQL